MSNRKYMFKLLVFSIVMLVFGGLRKKYSLVGYGQKYTSGIDSTTQLVGFQHLFWVKLIATSRNRPGPPKGSVQEGNGTPSFQSRLVKYYKFSQHVLVNLSPETCLDLLVKDANGRSEPKIFSQMVVSLTVMFTMVQSVKNHQLNKSKLEEDSNP